MTARLDAPERLLVAGLLGVAALCGLIAGANPGLAVGFASALAFVLLTVTNLPLALGLFCADPLRLDFDESGVIKLAGVLLVLAWLGATLYRSDSEHDFLTVHPAMSLVLGLFLGWSALSAVWAESAAETFTPDGAYALGIAIILIAFTAVRTRNQAIMVIFLFVLGAAAAALFGILTGPPADAEQERLANSYFDPNELASTLVAGAALAVGLAQCARRSPGLKLAAYTAAGFCVLGIFLSVSRGGLVALGVALIAALLLSGRWRGRVVLVAMLVVVSTVYYFAALAPQDARDRVLKTTKAGSTQSEGRASLWQVGWRMVEDKPVQGVGSGNFTVSERHYLLRPGAVWSSDTIIQYRQPAHNTFLGMLAELGAVGFLLFMSFVVFALRSALLAARNFGDRGDHGAEALARALAVGLIGLLAGDFFISQPYYKGMWLLLGLGPALLAISSRRPARPENWGAEAPKAPPGG
jgi:O-antigen ligase